MQGLGICLAFMNRDSRTKFDHPFDRGYLATLGTYRLSGKNRRYDSNIKPG